MTPRGLANARPGGGSGGHPQPPGLVAPLHPARWAPSSPAWDKTAGPLRLWVAGLAQGVVRSAGGGTGDTSRPLAWRHLNHGLLRGQLAGRGQFVVPAYCLWVAGVAQGVVRSPEVGNWGTPPHPRLSGT